MIITVVNVSAVETIPSGNGKSYQKVQVAFKGTNGQVTGKNLISFNNPQVFKFFTAGDLDGKNVDVNSIKNAKGFYEWTDAKFTDQEVSVATEPTKAASAGRGFETPEQRNARQQVITRIASVNSAVAFFDAVKGKPSLEEVLTTAQTIQAYVYDGVNPRTMNFIENEAPE